MLQAGPITGPVVFFAILFGLFLPFIVRVNETLGRTVGQLPGSVIIHAAGALFGGLFVLPFVARTWVDRLGLVPWWGFLGGVIGIGMVVMANLAVARLGTAAFVAVNVAAQLFSGALIDQFGLAGAAVQPVTLTRAVGLLLVAIGAAVVARG